MTIIVGRFVYQNYFLTHPTPFNSRVIKSHEIFAYNDLIDEKDRRVERLLRQLEPDLVLADQLWVLPSLLWFNYGFVSSTNPGIFRFEGYPEFGSDAGLEERKKMKEFANGLSPVRQQRIANLLDGHRRRGIPDYLNRSLPVDAPLSDRFPTIYMFPKGKSLFFFGWRSCIFDLSSFTSSRFHISLFEFLHRGGLLSAEDQGTLQAVED